MHQIYSSHHRPIPACRTPVEYFSPEDLAEADVREPDESRMSPVKWWSDHGHSLPDITHVAMKLGSIPPSAAGGERLWSAWGRIWCKGRASMLLGRAGLCAYVYFNQRVLDKQGSRKGGYSWGGWLQELASCPPLELDAAGRLVVPAVAAAHADNSTAQPIVID